VDANGLKLFARGKPLRDYGVHSQGIPGIIWDYWNYMGLCGIIWDYVELFGICDHLEYRFHGNYEGFHKNYEVFHDEKIFVDTYHTI
jgi:hypothetical protein